MPHVHNDILNVQFDAFLKNELHTHTKKKISKCSVLADKLVKPGMREKITKKVKH